MKRVWRFLTRPVVSVADAALMATAVAVADAMHLGLRLPWGWVLVIVWAATIAAVFGIGLVKGFVKGFVTPLHEQLLRRKRLKDQPGP